MSSSSLPGSVTVEGWVELGGRTVEGWLELEVITDRGREVEACTNEAWSENIHVESGARTEMGGNTATSGLYAMSTAQDDIPLLETTEDFDAACRSIKKTLAYPKKLAMEGQLGVSRQRTLLNEAAKVALKASVLIFCSEAGTFNEQHLGILLYKFLEECIQQGTNSPDFDLNCDFLQQDIYLEHVLEYHKPLLTIENAPRRPQPSTPASTLIPTSREKFSPPIGGQREPSTRTGSSIGSGAGKRKHVPSEDEDSGGVVDARPGARPKGQPISKPDAKRARSQARGSGMVSSTGITRTSSTGRSSQKRLADAINFVAEAATFANGLDGMDAGAGKVEERARARKKEKEREVEMEVEGDHKMEEGPPDEGEGMGGGALKEKGKKPRGTDQEKGQEKPEVKASAKGKGKLAKEDIKWNGVEGVNRCERCVSAKQKVCLRPAPGSTSNGIPVTACKSCKEKKTKCQWLVEGKTDNVINTDEEEEVSLSPPAKEASSSRHGGSKGSKPTQQLATKGTQIDGGPPNGQGGPTEPQVPAQGPPNTAIQVVPGMTIQRRPAIVVPVGADSDMTHEHPYDAVGILSKRISEREQAGREDTARLDALIHRLTQEPILTHDDYERIKKELGDLERRWIDHNTRLQELKKEVKSVLNLKNRIGEVETEMKRQAHIVNQFQFTKGSAVDPIVFEVVKDDIDKMKERAGRVREDVKEIKVGAGKMKQDVTSLQNNVSRVENELSDLRRGQEAMRNEREASLRISDGDVQGLHERVNKLLEHQKDHAKTTLNLSAQQQRSILEILQQIEEIQGVPELASTQGSDMSTVGGEASLFSISGRLRDLENNTLEALREASTQRRQEIEEMEQRIGDTLQDVLDKLKVLPEVMLAMKGITEKLAALETQVNNLNFSVYTHDGMYLGPAMVGPSGPPSPTARAELDNPPLTSKGPTAGPLQHPTSNTRTPLADKTSAEG
ncbi:hypothetical protein FA13DRAFT_1720441 [Coprinellus micaceus]|uniref:Uncharacterized protein n=1 Tax=Coprinellus micaceus TaxID=71717 RepID=A0A4Y7S9R1_COPMI|nr:hypothetical protein FA13DRAFT_1720441 [Coprinellus micaceus]